MTDIDISPEAVEPPCTCHPDDQPPKPCPQKYALTDCRIAALSAALTQSRAETAAAYEAAANEAAGEIAALGCHDLAPFVRRRVLTLTPADAKAALAAIEAAAEARGMRKAADVKGWENFVVDPAPLYLSHWQRGLVAGQKAMRDAILSAIPQGDPTND